MPLKCLNNQRSRENKKSKHLNVLNFSSKDFLKDDDIKVTETILIN